MEFSSTTLPIIQWVRDPVGFRFGEVRDLDMDFGILEEWIGGFFTAEEQNWRVWISFASWTQVRS